MHPFSRRLTATVTPRTQRVALLCATALLLSACANEMGARERGTAQGAAMGAVAGAVIGSMTGGKVGESALIGGAIGGVAGNLWSKHMEDKRKAMEKATAGTGVEVTRTADNQLKVQVPSDISFAVGSAALQPRLRPVLDTFANGLGSEKQMQIRIIGHTDNTGSAAVNDPLSERRAASVREYLEDRGLPRSRMTVSGRGSREPVASNDSADERARNRRVEIYLRETQSGS